MKKLLGFLLLCALLAFAACGGNDNGDDAEVATPPPQEDVTPDDTATQPADDPEPDEDEFVWIYDRREPRDMGGITMYVNAWWLPFDWDADQWREPSEPGTKSLYELWREAEERWNVNIEFTVAGWGENVELLTTSVLAGQPYADMVRLENWQAIPNLAAQGFLTAFEDIPHAITLDDIDPGVRLFGSFAGRHYGYIPYMGVGDGLFFNTDIIEREGLPCPFELFEQGQWNWESMIDMMRRASRVGPDGSVETYGMASWFSGLFLPMMLTNGGNMVDEINQQFVGDSPNTIEALEVMQQMMSENLLATYEAADVFLDGNALFIPMGPWFASRIREDMGTNFGFIPFPTGPRGSGHHSIGWGPNMYFIPRGANPEMLTIFHEVNREFRAQTIHDPDEWVLNYVNVERAIPAVLLMRQFFRTDRMNGFGIQNLMDWEGLEAGVHQPAPFIEGIRDQAQALIDNVFLP